MDFTSPSCTSNEITNKVEQVRKGSGTTLTDNRSSSTTKNSTVHDFLGLSDGISHSHSHSVPMANKPDPPPSWFVERERLMLDRQLQYYYRKITISSLLLDINPETLDQVLCQRDLQNSYREYLDTLPRNKDPLSFEDWKIFNGLNDPLMERPNSPLPSSRSSYPVSHLDHDPSEDDFN